LCAVRDGCSRRVIGWAIDDYLHTDLAQAALEMAVAMRGELAEQVVTVGLTPFRKRDKII